jgi:hypothetical protein
LHITGGKVGILMTGIGASWPIPDKQAAIPAE